MRAAERNKSSTRKSLLRIVIDTGTLLQALLLNDGGAKGLRQAWQHGGFTPLIDGVTAQALMRALAYPALQLNEAEQHEVLADFLPYAEVVVEVSGAAGATRQDLTPTLRLALAKPARADLLLSDSPELRMNFSRRISRAGKPVCRVLGADDFLRELQG